MTHTFAVSVVNNKSQAITDLHVSPQRAANIDPEAFLVLASEVERIARRLRQERARQGVVALRMFEEVARDDK